MNYLTQSRYWYHPAVVPYLDRPYTRASMTRLLPMLLFAGPLLAQTRTSTYSQTVHVTRSEQQVEIHSLPTRGQPYLAWPRWSVLWAWVKEKALSRVGS